MRTHRALTEARHLRRRFRAPANRLKVLRVDIPIGSGAYYEHNANRNSRFGGNVYKHRRNASA